jgi:hypothetical protein
VDDNARVSNPYAPPDPDRPRPAPPAWPTGAPAATEPAPGPARPPADPDGVARAGALTRTALLLLLAAVVVALLPAPWGAAAIAFTAGALGYGVRALLVAHQAHAEPPVVLVGALIAGSAALGLTLGAVSLYLMPAQLTYQRCLGSALTQQAQHECTNAYTSEVADLQQRVSGTS